MIEHLYRRCAKEVLFAAMAASAVIPLAATAQGYPNRPITVVVPTPAGGIVDSMARLLAQELSTAWKQPVVVDNKPGASGAIGATQVVRSPKDGYTALYTWTALVQLPLLGQKLPYDPQKDFVPVSQASLSSMALAVTPDFPANSVVDLVALLKASPDKYTYGSYGLGTTSHIYGELFKKIAGVPGFTQVPYKGSAPEIADLISGHLKIAFVDTATALPHLKAGKMKALAVIGGARDPFLPNVPTFKELGFQGFDAPGWNGFFLPEGTPPEIVQKMSTEVAKIIRRPDIAKKLAEWNVVAVGNTPKEFAAAIEHDSVVWKNAVEVGGARVDQ